MLYPVAGSCIFIADLPGSSLSDVPGGAWVEIAHAVAMGTMGGEFELEEVTDLESPEFDGMPAKAWQKGLRSQMSMQVVFGNDPIDPGQVVLWSAFRSSEHFPFRVVFPDGTTTRTWTALVTALVEVFDGANGVIRLQADILATSPFQHGGGA